MQLTVQYVTLTSATAATITHRVLKLSTSACTISAQQEIARTHTHAHTQLSFCLNDPLFQSYSKLGHALRVNSCELLWQNFYKPDALPVDQPTASKH